MRTRTFTGQQMQEALQDLLVPWVDGGAPFVLLDTPPRVIGENQITRLPGPVLPNKRGEGTTVRVQVWPEENLNALSVPYFGCVTEGEADIVIGTTAANCRQHKIEGSKWIVQMPQGSFFLLPPGVPIAAGGGIHWQRPHPENAYSRILWMQIHQAGANCHFSTSTRGQLRRHPYSYIDHKNLLPLAFALIREMQNTAPFYEPVVYYQLGLLVRYMQRAFEATKTNSLKTTSLLHPSALVEAKTLLRLDNEQEPFVNTTTPALSVAQRADIFINENLRDTTLTVEKLALHLQISPAQLNRIFRREYQCSVMAYVQERRLAHGAHLLAESSFSINQVSHYCGYGSASAFIKAFRRRYGLSPLLYRERQHTHARPYR
jgi:AraC-like DNA-binding protein